MEKLPNLGVMVAKWGYRTIKITFYAIGFNYLSIRVYYFTWYTQMTHLTGRNLKWSTPSTYTQRNEESPFPHPFKLLSLEQLNSLKQSDKLG